jgi:acetyltransferase-like isoleucine patch superfamily enzyme
MIRAMFDVIGRLGRPASRRQRWRARSDAVIARLRSRGATIGDECVIFTDHVPLEPYLVEIGDRVAIAGGTVFITHDGAAWLLRRSRPDAQHFGRIVVGSDTFIGQNCTLLPGVRIGSNCVVGAGAVVRGVIPDGAVVMGNPATVVGRTGLFLELMNASPDTLDTFSLPADERERRVRAHFGRP